MPDSQAEHTFPSPRPGLALALVYGTLFLAGGFYLPFFPVFLAAQGLSPELIGIVVGIPIAVRLFANPTAGVMSDRIGRPRRFLAVLGTGAAIAFALMVVLPSGPAAIMVLIALAAVFWGPLFPLTDAFGVRLARERGVDYGRARLWGSVTFIAANLALGAVLEILPAASIVWFIVGSLGVFVASTFLMPRLQEPGEAGLAPPPQFNLRTKLGIVAAACVQSSHALLYAFGSVHWGASGISSTVIGALWAAGVAAEVVFFYFGSVALRRFSALGLILLGGVSSIVRFSFTALDPPQGLLALLMTMHAFTFTATFLGMVSLAAQSAGAGAMGRAQTFASAAVSVVMLLATFAAGPLYAHYGAYAFFGSAGIAALGCALALAAMLQPQSSGEGGNTRAPS